MAQPGGGVGTTRGVLIAVVLLGLLVLYSSSPSSSGPASPGVVTAASLKGGGGGAGAAQAEAHPRVTEHIRAYNAIKCPSAADIAGDSAYSSRSHAYVEQLKTKAFLGEYAKGSLGQPSMEGQVKGTFAKFLFNYASHPRVRTVLEVGTWRGAGSSLSLATAVGAKDGALVTVEAVEHVWGEAVGNLAGLPVDSLLGTNGGTVPDEHSIEDMGDKFFPQMAWRDWRNGEAALAKQYADNPDKCPLMQGICASFVIDMAFLDGAEFGGPSDYLLARKHCPQLKVLALHDTNVFKNWAAKTILISDPEWEMTAFGDIWAIFVRTDVLSSFTGNDYVYKNP